MVEVLTRATDTDWMQNLQVWIGTNLCESLPGDMKPDRWYLIYCNKGQGITGKTVKITSASAATVQLCGIKVFGFQQEVRYSVVPGRISSLDIDNDDIPYVINRWKEVYKLNGDTWEITEHVGKDISISSFGQPWMVSPDNKLQYNEDGVWKSTDLSDIKRVAVGQDDVYLVTFSNKL